MKKIIVLLSTLTLFTAVSCVRDRRQDQQFEQQTLAFNESLAGTWYGACLKYSADASSTQQKRLIFNDYSRFTEVNTIYSDGDCTGRVMNENALTGDYTLTQFSLSGRVAMVQVVFNNSVVELPISATLKIKNFDDTILKLNTISKKFNSVEGERVVSASDLGEEDAQFYARSQTADLTQMTINEKQQVLENKASAHNSTQLCDTHKITNNPNVVGSVTCNVVVEQKGSATIGNGSAGKATDSTAVKN